MAQNYLQSLRQIAVLAGMSDEALSCLVYNAKLLERRPGEYFFREGEPGDQFYILLEGEISLERMISGSRITLCKLGVGDCCGEMSLVDLMPRSNDARATAESFALEIRQACLTNLFKLHPEQYSIVMMNMGREISRRMRISENQLLELCQPQVPGYSAVAKRNEVWNRPAPPKAPAEFV